MQKTSELFLLHRRLPEKTAELFWRNELVIHASITTQGEEIIANFLVAILIVIKHIMTYVMNYRQIRLETRESYYMSTIIIVFVYILHLIM